MSSCLVAKHLGPFSRHRRSIRSSARTHRGPHGVIFSTSAYDSSATTSSFPISAPGIRYSVSVSLPRCRRKFAGTTVDQAMQSELLHWRKIVAARPSRVRPSLRAGDLPRARSRARPTPPARKISGSSGCAEFQLFEKCIVPCIQFHLDR